VDERTQETRETASSLAGWSYRALIVAAVVVALLLLWRIADVLLLAFGGILLAIGLRALAEALAQRTGRPQRIAFWALLAVLVAAVVGGGFAVGGQVAEQFAELWQRLPAAVQGARDWLSQSPFSRMLPDLGSLMSDGASNAEGGQGGTASAAAAPAARFFSTTLGALGNTFVVLFVAIYVGADPQPYRRGLVRLVPPRGRPRAEHTLDAAHDALRKWLLGKVLTMLAVGALTTGGLMALGVPLALPLGIVAALLDFIPYIGPLIAVVPALLLAMAENPSLALYVALLYLAVQQLEGNLIEPMLQRWAVDVQPALLILGVLAFGVVFGPLGVLFGAPLMVLGVVLTQQLYIDAALERQTADQGAISASPGTIIVPSRPASAKPTTADRS
jgi:predicted PurR-regulated permease PerM